jgi:tetratricopeptide (TPR) repeat protein
MQMAHDTAQKAISADARFPETYALLGHVHNVRGDTKLAIAMCEKAVRLAPSDSLMLALLSEVLIDAGKLKEGIQKIQRALRLCPFPPSWYLSSLGLGFHLSGNNEAAVFALNLAVEREPGSHYARVWLASTLAEMGRLDEASAISKAVLDIEPSFSVVRWVEHYRSITHARLRDNLLAAGLPE